jgi:CheY-like chemotaxis protein
MTSEAKTVMVVEDIPNLLEMIVQMLDANNYKTIKAKDGQECLDKLKEEIPDIRLVAK